MLLLLLSRFSRVWLCVTPQTAAHQALPYLGFSRQEHWSGLPFPSPMHESEKWKWSRSVVSNSLQPCGLQPIRLLCPWEFPGKNTGVGCHCLLHPYVTKRMHILWPTNSILRYLLKINENKCLQKDLYKDIHNSFIHKSPKLETDQLFISWRINLKLCSSHNGLLLRNKEKQTTDIHNNMNES